MGRQVVVWLKGLGARGGSEHEACCGVREFRDGRETRVAETRIFAVCCGLFRDLERGKRGRVRKECWADRVAQKKEETGKKTVIE